MTPSPTHRPELRRCAASQSIARWITIVPVITLLPSELSDFCLLSRLTNLEHLELNTFYLDRDEFHEIFDPASRGEAFRSLKTCKLDHAKSIAI